MSSRQLARLFLAAAALASPALSDVLYVDGSGRGDFTTLQAAVDAAQDGDLVLVRTGDYAPFTVDGKALWIRADAGAQVQVHGKVTVRQIAADQDLVLAGLSLAGEESPSAPLEALRIEQCAGDVRVEDCTLAGGDGAGSTSCTPWPSGGHALRVALCDSVVLVGCNVLAGDGQGDDVNGPACTSGVGGIGAVLEAADAWFFECTLRGGKGGDNQNQAANGGAGLVAAVGGRAFLSGSLVQGGKGGTGWETLDGIAGDGGNGVQASSNSAIEHVDCDLLGGLPGGSISTGPGDPGLATSGPGSFTAHGGAARSLAGPTLVPAFAPTAIQYTGEPGDQIWLLASRSADLHATPGAIGDWLVQFPMKVTQSPHVVLGATTTAMLQVPAVQLPAGATSGSVHVQALVRDSGGQVRFSGVLAVRAVDCASLQPDCNGNGDADTCELLAGAQDCDLDGQPDDCEADCNANGEADACDISSGASEDFNANGIPDECDGVGVVWYVDDDAALGGNGSETAPFNTLAQAFAVALSTHEIELADGSYTGPQNRSLSFAGRDMTVRSANGPAGCVIDLQGQGRAFHMPLGETVTLAGLTLRNGNALVGGAVYVESGELSVAACRFESCTAQGSAGSSGGAIATRLLGPGTRVLRVAGSTFTGCAALNGGAISADSAILEIEGCGFTGNSAANSGGAIGLWMDGGHSRIVQSQFLGNVAGNQGGAIRSGSQQAANLVEISDCLIAGSVGNHGGALFGFGRMEVRDSTLAANAGNLRGGAIRLGPGGELRLASSVVWDNTSPDGAALALGDAGFGATATVTHSLVQGGQAGVAQGAGSTLQWLAGNLDVDPLFVDADGPDGNPLTLADNDWRLGAGSPGLDAGDNAEVSMDLLDLDGDANLLEPLPFDLDGGPRFVDDPAPDSGSGTTPLVDLGAYER